MSDASTTQTVECPICEDEFDPTVAGGWCTNTECGEWQYTEGDDDSDAVDDGFVSPAEMDEKEADDDAGDETAAESVQSPSDIADVGDDEEEEDEDVVESEADESTDDEPTDDEPTEADVEDADVEDTEADEGDDVDVEDEPAADEESDTESALECPDCGVELDADANFCVECGADVTAADASEELEACPSCAADVEPEDSFCVNCGEDLDAHREGDAGADDEETDADDAIDALAEDEPVPDALVLAVEGIEITVEDGEKVGREVRAALMDAGRPEEEAVRIHREHVRFVREEDSFYVLDLGDNPTALNGTSLTKGDREPIGHGDELELSGVATVDVRAA